MEKETNENEIFDWVVEFEDECIKRVRDEVILTAEYNFGKEGRRIAEKYYRAIDGEEFLSEADEDCDDCKKRAEMLVKKATFITKISDILYDDTITEILKEVKLKNNIDVCLDNVIKQINDNTCFKVNDKETKNRIKTAFLLECCRELQEND